MGRQLPLQTPRLLSTVNFLLAVPAGYALAMLFETAGPAFGEGVERAGKGRPADPRRGILARGFIRSAGQV